jgi:hypothetical protein
VREILDLSVVLEQLIDRMISVNIAACLDCDIAEDSDIFSKMSPRSEYIKYWWVGNIEYGSR